MAKPHRFLSGRVGRTDPASGLQVFAKRAFDFEFQVSMHLATAVKKWPMVPRAVHEESIRKLLATGQAWLYPEPYQPDLFGGVANG